MHKACQAQEAPAIDISTYFQWLGYAGRGGFLGSFMSAAHGIAKRCAGREQRGHLSPGVDCFTPSVGLGRVIAAGCWPP